MDNPCLHSEDINVLGNTTTYTHKAAGGTKYSVQIASKSIHSKKQSPFTEELSVETLSKKPHKPKILDISSDDSGTVHVDYDYPCPFTGPTEFKVLVECQKSSKCDSNHFQNMDYLNLRENFFLVSHFLTVKE